MAQPHYQKELPLVELNEPKFIDCFGGVTNVKYMSGFGGDAAKRQTINSLLKGAEFYYYTEEIFDYNDLIEAVQGANKKFSMVELGAGWGRWLVHAANLCKLLGKEVEILIGYEAEPTHFQWMQEHFVNNNLDPKNHKLIQGVMGAEDGVLPFYVGDSTNWYGQSIAHNIIDYHQEYLKKCYQKEYGFFGKAKKSIKKLFNLPSSTSKVHTVSGLPPFQLVPCHSLKTALKDYDFIDFMHMDIQGAEFDVLSVAQDVLNRKVKKIHIGTHSPTTEATKGRDMDALLYELFSMMGWENINRVKPNEQLEIDGYTLNFQDGVQTWVNPYINA